MKSFVLNKILSLLIYLKMVFVARRYWKALVKKTYGPEKAQKEVLRRILNNNADTGFGVTYKFPQISNVEQFRHCVPVHNYEELRVFIDKQEKEKKAYITREQPFMYAQTSGTTGVPKYVPILDSSVSHYKKAQQAFSYALYTAIPGVYKGKVLSIRSPAIEGYLETGTPYGAMSSLIEKSMPLVVRSKFVVPNEVFEIEDYGLKYYLIALFSLVENDISLIGSANPSTLLHLSDVIQKEASELIRDINTGSVSRLEGMETEKMDSINRKFVRSPRRSYYLENLLSATGGLKLAAIWPDLKAVCTWMGGSCKVLIPSLKHLLPSTTQIIEIGYLSSEFRGSNTIDASRNLCIPSIDENFYEFVQKEQWENHNPVFCTVNQIEFGKQYYVFATTQNGLYRYDINDIVEVTGKYNETPTIEFVQKGKGVTNITGEKLYESHLIQVVIRVRRELGIDVRFFMMLADPVALKYSLYLESKPDEGIDLLGYVETQLFGLNIEFESKRKSGRLRPTELIFLENGTGEEYKKYCIGNGQREGQYKVAHLHF